MWRTAMCPADRSAPPHQVGPMLGDFRIHVQPLDDVAERIDVDRHSSTRTTSFDLRSGPPSPRALGTAAGVDGAFAVP